MNQRQTMGIVLSRVDYGEADRIVTVLTGNDGKITLMAKGVRKVRSKLAGGIELFSISELLYVPGKGSIGTLVSARLIEHASSVTSDVQRTMFGYDMLKMMHKITEDTVEPELFEVLAQSVRALGDLRIGTSYIEMWLGAQLLSHTGHMPNLIDDTDGDSLVSGQRYDFDFEHVAFKKPPEGQGAFDTDQIKFLRVLFGSNTLSSTRRVSVADDLTKKLSPLIVTLRQFYLSI